MSFKEKLEDKIQNTERRLVELSLILKKLDREYQKLLDEMSVTPEAVKSFVENPDHFPPPIWEQLQNEKKMRDEKLNMELSCVPDLTKTKKTMSERSQIQQHWLHVR